MQLDKVHEVLYFYTVSLLFFLFIIDEVGVVKRTQVIHRNYLFLNIHVIHNFIL